MGPQRGQKADCLCSDLPDRVFAIMELGGRHWLVGTAGFLTCIRTPGISSDSQFVELLTPVIGISISNPCTEVRDQDEGPPTEVIFVVPRHSGHVILHLRVGWAEMKKGTGTGAGRRREEVWQRSEGGR